MNQTDKPGAHTRLLSAQTSVLVVIDLQGKLMDMVYRPQLVKQATIRLMQLAELFEVPVILTEQYPKGLGPTVRSLAELAGVGPLVKETFSCAGDPGFRGALATAGRRQAVVTGIEAHVCVMQTVLGARARGEAVQLCWDAVSGRGEEHRRWAVERMRQAGAQITNTESVGFEWARDKNHPRFRDLSELIKQGLPDGGG